MLHTSYFGIRVRLWHKAASLHEENREKEEKKEVASDGTHA